MKTFKHLIAFIVVILNFQIAFAQSWSITGNAGTSPNTNFLGTTDNKKLNIRTNNQTRMTITSGGLVGIGITSPSSELHLTGTMQIDRSSIAGNTTPAMILNGVANNIVTVLKVDGIRKSSYGYDVSTNDFVIATDEVGLRPDFIINRTNGFVGLNTKTPGSRLHIQDGDLEITNGLENFFIRTNASGQLDLIPNNSSTAAAITIDDDNSNVGVGTSSPACDFHLVIGTGSSTTFGLRIANEGSNNNFWNFYTENSNAKLDLNANGTLRGTFDATSGTYTALSDERLKKDIENMSDVLPSIMKLNVKKYHFTQNQSSDRKYIGLLAQDVMKIFPEVVYNNQCDDGQQVYTMDYSSFGVLAVKAIQELNAVVAEKDVVISDLQKQIDDIKSSLQACGMTCFNESEKSSGITGEARLFQNEPNPANQTTMIRFTIPSNTRLAQLIITDAFGKTIQQFSNLTIDQSQVELSTSNLSSGIYQYTLYIDGRKVDSKQMIITK